MPREELMPSRGAEEKEMIVNTMRMRKPIIRLAQTAYVAAAFFFVACAASPTASKESPVQADPLAIDIHSLANKILADIPDNIPLTLAVFDFSTPEGYTVFSHYLTDELGAALHESGRIRIIERENLDQIMREQEYQLSGYVDDDTAKNIGKIIGVDLLCTGRITELPQTLLVSCRIIEVETGTVLSIVNREIAKNDRVIALLSNKSRTDEIASNQDRNVPVKSASDQNNPTNSTVAAIPSERPIFEPPAADMTTEEGQMSAVKTFIPFVIDNLLEINIRNIEMPETTDRAGLYPVKFIWEYKENYDVIRAMADFFRTFPVEPRPHELFASREIDVTYYPTPYANRPERIDILLASKKVNDVMCGFHGSSGAFRWDLEFTIFDQHDYPIDVHKASIRFGYQNLGKHAGVNEYTFNLNRQAYEMMKDIRLTKVTGGVPQYGGRLFYK
jgi:hypothetical protein